jgi:NAD+ synthase
MKITDKKNKIISWLKKYNKETQTECFVVGVSGGVDSALTSTLCALTGVETYLVTLPIRQAEEQINRAKNHINWLLQNHKNIKSVNIDLTETFEVFSRQILLTELSQANARSRMRMMSLYSIANNNNGLVVGTGNKIEDYGIGFFTKYGDGGVDLSPIADLLKSEVREMARHLGVLSELCEAVPTDGLWADNRSDEDQIGASYEELEWALNYFDQYGNIDQNLSNRQKNILDKYVTRHFKNKHKLQIPPVCLLGEES